MAPPGIIFSPADDDEDDRWGRPCSRSAATSFLFRPGLRNLIPRLSERRDGGMTLTSDEQLR